MSILAGLGLVVLIGCLFVLPITLLVVGLGLALPEDF